MCVLLCPAENRNSHANYLPRPASGERAGVRGCFSSSDRSVWRNSVEILDNIVVPDADHAITEGVKCAIALLVLGAFCVLAAVELDNQAPLAANKVDVVSSDRLLADKFEGAQLPAAKACPRRELCRREGAA
jgi:hypothetical protein